MEPQQSFLAKAINEVKLKKYFAAGVIGGVLALLPLPFIVVLLALLSFDWKSEATLKQYLSVISSVSFVLVYFMYLSITCIPATSAWSSSLQLFILSLCVFHLGEFYAQSYFHYKEANFSSNGYAAYLLDHSTEYTVAISSAFVEHFIKLIIPYPSFYLFYYVGGAMVFIGHVFRIGSEINCGKNFTHRIKYKKVQSHVLVINGFYRLCRHPSYFGWFFWSVGTQVMLGNVICCIGFYLSSKNFFRSRIEHEEEFLISFFGQDYLKYIENTSKFFPGWNSFLD